jgi:hypothetical protein
MTISTTVTEHVLRKSSPEVKTAAPFSVVVTDGHRPVRAPSTSQRAKDTTHGGMQGQPWKVPGLYNAPNGLTFVKLKHTRPQSAAAFSLPIDVEPTKSNQDLGISVKPECAPAPPLPPHCIRARRTHSHDHTLLSDTTAPRVWLVMLAASRTCSAGPRAPHRVTCASTSPRRRAARGPRRRVTRSVLLTCAHPSADGRTPSSAHTHTNRNGRTCPRMRRC